MELRQYQKEIGMQIEYYDKLLDLYTAKKKAALDESNYDMYVRYMCIANTADTMKNVFMAQALKLADVQYAQVQEAQQSGSEQLKPDYCTK